MLALLFHAIFTASIANCLAAPHSGGSLTNIELPACNVSGNAIKNGGFENGLKSWKVTQAYNGPPGAMVSCGVVDMGYESQHSAEISGDATPADDGNNIFLSQEFETCGNATYTLSWSLFQVENVTHHTFLAPSLDVELYPPLQHFAPDIIAEFDFGNNYYNASNYGAFGSENVYTKGQAGVWNSYDATFPTNATGKWIVRFALNVDANHHNAAPAAATIRIDGVAAS